MRIPIPVRSGDGAFAVDGQGRAQGRTVYLNAAFARCLLVVYLLPACGLSLVLNAFLAYCLSTCVATCGTVRYLPTYLCRWVVDWVALFMSQTTTGRTFLCPATM